VSRGQLSRCGDVMGVARLAPWRGVIALGEVRRDSTPTGPPPNRHCRHFPGHPGDLPARRGRFSPSLTCAIGVYMLSADVVLCVGCRCSWLLIDNVCPTYALAVMFKESYVNAYNLQSPLRHAFPFIHCRTKHRAQIYDRSLGGFFQAKYSSKLR
jgi:hypothetical protein